MPPIIPIVNPKDLAFLAEKESVFHEIVEQYGTPPEWNRPPNFVTLCQLILEQQVSVASGKAHFEALNKYVGEFIPEKLATLSPEEYRACHISRQKAAYLKGLAQTVLDGDLIIENLVNLSEEEIRKELTKIKGIGNWTADTFLLLALSAKDIMPLSDIAIIRAIEDHFGVKGKEEMIALTNTWRPKRSLATFLLWWAYLKKRNREY